jgi:hypothetical protein
VNFPHIANWWISIFHFQKDRELPKFQENKVLKTLLQSLSFEILFFSSQKKTNLDQFLTFFRKKNQNLSGKLSGKTEKHNIGIHWYASSSKAWSSQISACYPDGLRIIFDHFSRKFQNFSEKLLSEFQKIPNLSIHFYFSISNEWSCRNSALYLLPRLFKTFLTIFQENLRVFQGNY